MKESEAPHQKVRKIDLFMPSFIWSYLKQNEINDGINYYDYKLINFSNPIWDISIVVQSIIILSIQLQLYVSICNLYLNKQCSFWLLVLGLKI
jgi:hypothetical protein